LAGGDIRPTSPRS